MRLLFFCQSRENQNCLSAKVNSFEVRKFHAFEPSFFFSSVIERYNEVCDVDFTSSEDLQSGTESFAQLIWKDTQRVGFAVTSGRNKNQTCQYIAGVFRPPGNIDGFYGENVLKGDFDQKYCDEL